MLCWFLVALSSLATLHVAQAQYGGFAESCHSISVGATYLQGEGSAPPTLYGWFLYATCPGPHGNLYNQLKLGDCLGNHDGTLVAQPNGGFGGSCDSCQIYGGVACPSDKTSCFDCQCHNSHGGKQIAFLDLNAGIVGNSNGVLVCRGGRAEDQNGNPYP